MGFVKRKQIFIGINTLTEIINLTWIIILTDNDKNFVKPLTSQAIITIKISEDYRCFIIIYIIFISISSFIILWPLLSENYCTERIWNKHGNKIKKITWKWLYIRRLIYTILMNRNWSFVNITKISNFRLMFHIMFVHDGSFATNNQFYKNDNIIRWS